MGDWYYWTQFDNLQLKGLLESELPAQVVSAEEIVRGAAASGDPQKAQALANMSVLDHVRARTREQAAKFCCKLPAAYRPSELDYLDVVEATAGDNLRRLAYYLINGQGRADQAMAVIDSVAPAYRDYPPLAAMRAMAGVKLLAQSGNGGQAPQVPADSIRHDALVAILHEPTAAFASTYVYNNFMQGNPVFKRLLPLYIMDYPVRSDYPRGFGGSIAQALPVASAALSSSTTDVGPLLTLFQFYGRDPATRAQLEPLFKAAESRFCRQPGHGQPAHPVGHCPRRRRQRAGGGRGRLPQHDQDPAERLGPLRKARRRPPARRAGQGRRRRARLLAGVRGRHQ